MTVMTANKTSHCLACGMNLAGYSEDAEFCENHGGQKDKQMSAVEKFFHLFEKGGERMSLEIKEKVRARIDCFENIIPENRSGSPELEKLKEEIVKNPHSTIAEVLEKIKK